MNTNLLALIPLLQALCANHPTNSLPPLAIPIIEKTNSVPWTNWILTGEFKVEHGVRSDKSVMDSVGTNVEREVVTAVIFFRTNHQTLSWWATHNTNEVKWDQHLPPLPGVKQKE